MKPYAKKLLVMSAMAVGLLSSTIQSAKALDNADVEASVETRTAIAVVNNANIDFGLLDVTIATQTATLVLNPNTGAVTGGSATVVASGTPAKGQVTITTDGGSDIDVTCDDEATLENVDGDLLTVSAVRIEATAGATFPSALCTGAAQAMTPTAPDIVLGVGGTLDLAFGGANKVEAGSFLATDDYNTTRTNGVPINIQAVYQ